MIIVHTMELWHLAKRPRGDNNNKNIYTIAESWENVQQYGNFDDVFERVSTNLRLCPHKGHLSRWDTFDSTQNIYHSS